MLLRIMRIAMLTLLIILMDGCKPSEEAVQKEEQISKKVEVKENKSVEKSVSEGMRDSEIILRFLEIGSDGCLPCKMMRPVMEKVSDNYDNVRVLFYETNSDSGMAVARKYNVRLIPTQIFLDNDDNVIKRHEGFYAFEDMSMFIDSFIGEN